MATKIEGIICRTGEKTGRTLVAASRPENTEVISFLIVGIQINTVNKYIKKLEINKNEKKSKNFTSRFTGYVR